MEDFESGSVGYFLQLHKKGRTRRCVSMTVHLSLPPGHQQLSSSHATDRVTAVAVPIAGADAARIETQVISVA